MGPIPPPPSVIEAFALSATPALLPGGQGQSFRTGPAVIKFVGPDEAEEAEWTSHTLANLPSSPNFSIPPPIIASNGKYVYESWTAVKFCEGTDLPVGHWDELFTAARAFHRALEGVPEPEFMRRRMHPWAKADRVAWGEESAIVVASLARLYEKLLVLCRDVKVQAQLVHGDLSGNILFGAAKPVVIDSSPFWRCVEYSVAIAVADGIADFGEGEDILVAAGFMDKEDGQSGKGWEQMLVRALIFRVVARSELVGVMGEASEREMKGFERVMKVIEKYV